MGLLTEGSIASILNPLREKNSFGKTSGVNFDLSYWCNYLCDICFNNSGPNRKGTELDESLVFGLLPFLRGIDEIIGTGGEITFVPYFRSFIQESASIAKMVTIYSNGSALLDRKVMNHADGEPKRVELARKSLEATLSSFPPNVEYVLPVTLSHLNNNLPSHKFHRAIIKAGVSLANEWFADPSKPKVRVIVKKDPRVENSGEQLIEEFGLTSDLAATGSTFPGNIIARGRGVDIEGAMPVGSKKVNFPQSTSAIQGKIYINYLGVYANDGAMLDDVGETLADRGGRICIIDPKTTGQTIADSLKYFVNQHPQT